MPFIGPIEHLTYAAEDMSSAAPILFYRVPSSGYDYFDSIRIQESVVSPEGVRWVISRYVRQASCTTRPLHGSLLALVTLGAMSGHQ